MIWIIHREHNKRGQLRNRFGEGDKTVRHIDRHAVTDTKKERQRYDDRDKDRSREAEKETEKK